MLAVDYKKFTSMQGPFLFTTMDKDTKEVSEALFVRADKNREKDCDHEGTMYRPLYWFTDEDSIKKCKSKSELKINFDTWETTDPEDDNTLYLIFSEKESKDFMEQLVSDLSELFNIEKL